MLGGAFISSTIPGSFEHISFTLNGFMFETSCILMFMMGPIHVHCKCLTVSQKSVDLLEIIFCGNQHYAPPLNPVN